MQPGGRLAIAPADKAPRHPESDQDGQAKNEDEIGNEDRQHEVSANRVFLAAAKVGHWLTCERINRGRAHGFEHRLEPAGLPIGQR